MAAWGSPALVAGVVLWLLVLCLVWALCRAAGGADQSACEVTEETADVGIAMHETPSPPRGSVR